SLLGEACSHGYQVIVLHPLVREVNPILDWRCLREMRELLARISPAVVHTHSSKAGVIGRMAAYDVGTPAIVHTIHGMSFNRTQTWPIQTLYRGIEQFCAAYTDHIITVADAMTAQAVEAGIALPNRFSTVYSGIRTDWFDPNRFDRQAIRQKWGFGPEHIVVGKIARMSSGKGYEHLIPAMTVAAREDSRLRFVWIGDGQRRQEYERRLVDAGIRDRVHLVGLVLPHEIARVLCGMDMLVHASEWEGLARTLVQALLMERPVISFNIDGAPEVVYPGVTGELIALGQQEALTAAILKLAANAELRQAYGRAGRALCLERFDHHFMVDRIVDVYERCSPKPARPA
ncbi:MAG: glycosyltransferase, partial [Phycisphaerae bacterium]|nr:glycosyltransferase [Phycisphaerae bacterium]